MCFYSLTKRFTDFTHVWLGIALAAAPVGAWLAVEGGFHFLPRIEGKLDLRHSALVPLNAIKHQWHRSWCMQPLAPLNARAALQRGASLAQQALKRALRNRSIEEAPDRHARARSVAPARLGMSAVFTTR